MTLAPCDCACSANANPISDEPPSTITRWCCKPFPRSIEFSLCTLLAYTVKDDSLTTCGSCIIVMVTMRLEKLRQVDLNLLITFAAVAEEKSITPAASRLRLTPPAASRALQRARMMFQADLLVGSPQDFQLPFRSHTI